MMTKKLYKRKDIPPCPNPAAYTLIRMKNNLYYWRRKRGTVIPARLNAAFIQNVELTKLLSPLCTKITEAISSFWTDLPLNGWHVAVLTAIKRYYKEKGCIRYSHLKNLELQPQYPFRKLFTGPAKISIENELLNLRLLVTNKTVIRSNGLVTDFYFESVMIIGDISVQEKLITQSEQSELFSFQEKIDRTCTFSFAIPRHQPWILFLKIACYEGNQKAAHYKNYAMKIIETGFGKGYLRDKTIA